MAHENWIKSILNQMKEIKLGLNITDAEIVRTNSTGLTIYNPKNLADRIKGMKNKKEQTREEKIKARLLYEQNQSENSLN